MAILDISVRAWRKTHPELAVNGKRIIERDDDGDGDHQAEREHRIRQLVDDGQMWRALGKDALADACEAAIERLRSPQLGAPREAGKRRYESSSDAYQCAMRRREKMNACSED
jgi:hypothetical protein